MEKCTQSQERRQTNNLLSVSSSVRHFYRLCFCVQELVHVQRVMALFLLSAIVRLESSVAEIRRVKKACCFCSAVSLRVDAPLSLAFSPSFYSCCFLFPVFRSFLA